MADAAAPAAEPAAGDKRKREEEDAGAAAAAVPLDGAAVMKQLKFYFSDSNLPRDKFLKGLVSKDEEGWVDFATIAKFKRMLDLCPSADVAKLAAVIRDAADDFLEVTDDSTKIRRSPKHPLPAESLFEKRAIYAKGWDLKGTTIESVEKYFTDKGYKVLSVRLRRAVATREFKGSTFVELSSVEEAKKCAAEKHKIGDRDLLVEMKEAYHERKCAEKKEARKKKKAEKAAANGDGEAAAADAGPDYEAECVLGFEGLTDETTREDIKEVFDKLGSVSWVDFQRGDTAGEIRFAAGGEAVKAKEAYEKDPVEINGKVPTLRVLKGEDEKAFWVKVVEGKKQRFERSKRKSGGGFGGKGNWRGKGRGDKRKSGGGGGGGSPKKAKTD